MQAHDYQRVIDELQTLIDEARELITRAEAYYGDAAVPRDYDPTYEIYRWAVAMQRHCTLEMLKTEPSPI